MQEVVDLRVVTALQHLSQLLDLDVASVVHVEVLEGLAERLSHVDLAFVVHGDDELVEVYLP